MQVLTAEETTAAIAAAVEPLIKKIAFLESALEQNSDLLTASEASRLSGIKDTRTLKKRFTPYEDGGKVKFSRVEILKWKDERRIEPTPNLKLTA